MRSKVVLFLTVYKELVQKPYKHDNFNKQFSRSFYEINATYFNYLTVYLLVVHV
jgi:hypothetical protein